MTRTLVSSKLLQGQHENEGNGLVKESVTAQTLTEELSHASSTANKACNFLNLFPICLFLPVSLRYDLNMNWLS